MSKKIKYSNEPIDAEVIRDFLPRPESRDRKFPPGWDEERVRRVVEHYESQSEDEAVAEDEAALDSSLATVMNVPKELVPEIRELIARRKKSV